MEKENIKEKMAGGWYSRGALGAHRLDGGRVGGFPDWTLRPGEIRRRRLEKQRSNKLNNCSYFHSVH